MTDKELELVAVFLDGVARDGDWENEDGTPIDPIIIREAARRLREQDGERIWVDVHARDYVPHEIYAERDDAEAAGYEPATLILDPQEPEK